MLYNVSNFCRTYAELRLDPIYQEHRKDAHDVCNPQSKQCYQLSEELTSSFQINLEIGRGQRA
jgi:hypothetical protein